MRKSDARPFLTAEWRDLVVVNFDVPARLLEPHVPAGTELDSWHGRTLASVVGFLFRDTKILGLTVPGHRTFEEVNLRFYVRRHDPTDGWRRGVVFLRELVPRRAIAWVAKWAYHEPYRYARMGHHRFLDGQRRGEIGYHWALPVEWGGGRGRRRGQCELGGRVLTESAPLSPGSEAEFITEHYWGYTRQRDGRTLEYRVDHPRWRVAPLADPTLTGDLRPWYGEELSLALGGGACSGFFSEGSPVVVFTGSRLC